MVSPLDPVALLLLAVAVLASTGLVVWRLHPLGIGDPHRGSVPHDQPSLVVGDPAQSVLNRAARLQADELRQLQRDYRRLDRFWSGGWLERSLDIVGGALQFLQPTGNLGASFPILQSCELRARLAVGDACEAALLARAGRAIEHAAAMAGLPPTREMARAVADAAIALEAGGDLTPNDRSTLAWPWRDATDHVTTIPEPGTIVPRRFAVVTAALVAVLAVLAISGGTAPSVAIAVSLGLGSVLIAAVLLFRLVVWHPILRAPLAADAGRAPRAHTRQRAGEPPRRGALQAAAAPEPRAVPRRFALVVMAIAAVLAALAMVGGSGPVEAIGVFGVIGGIVVAAAALARRFIWWPIRRAWAGRALGQPGASLELPARFGEPLESIVSADDTTSDDSALPFGPRTPSSAIAGHTDIDLPALGLGVLAVVVFGLVGSQVLEGRLDAVWAAVATALPASLAGVLGSRAPRGVAESMVWHIGGAVVAAGAGLIYIAVVVDPGGEVWPYLVVLAPVVIGVPILIGYGAGAWLGRRRWTRSG